MTSAPGMTRARTDRDGWILRTMLASDPINIDKRIFLDATFLSDPINVISPEIVDTE